MKRALRHGLPLLLLPALGCGAKQIAGTVDPREVAAAGEGSETLTPSAYAREFADRFNGDPCEVGSVMAARSFYFDPRVEAVLRQLATTAEALCTAGVGAVTISFDERGELATHYDGAGAIVADDRIVVLGEFSGARAPLPAVDSLPFPACGGFFGEAADYELVVTDEIPITMEINNPDAVVLVVSPGGRETCSSESASGGALVNLTTGQGTHEIWVGSTDQSRKEYTLELASGASAGSVWVWRDGASTSFPVTVINPQRAAYEISSICTGFVMAEPSFTVWIPEGRYDYVSATTDGDGVIVAQGPSGAVQCNDDYNGLNPGLDVYFEPGEWTFWVGAYSAGASLTGTITFQ